MAAPVIPLIFMVSFVLVWLGLRTNLLHRLIPKRPKRPARQPDPPIIQVDIRAALAGLGPIPDHDHHFIDEADLVQPLKRRLKPKAAPRATAKPKPKPKTTNPPTPALSFSANWHLQITYDRGTRAGQSRRIIVMRATGFATSEGFHADTILTRCESARDWRRFKTDHITALIDLETGEIANDPQSWIDRKIAENP